MKGKTKNILLLLFFLKKILPTAHTEHHQYNVMQCVHVLYLRLISWGGGGEFPFPGGSFWLLWMDTCRYGWGRERLTLTFSPAGVDFDFFFLNWNLEVVVTFVFPQSAKGIELTCRLGGSR